jgi:prephenate dehydrogenase
MDNLPAMRCRGLRGATTTTANTPEAILAATRELLERLVQRNGLAVDDIASAFFTVTDDLDAAYPALAARQLGWSEVALLCAREIPVPGSVARCIRVLLHINTTLGPSDLRHVYLREAVSLRPGFADEIPATIPTETSTETSTETAAAGNAPLVNRVVILGLGLMGGSLGLAVRQRGLACTVAGYDLTAGVAELARQRGAVDVACASVAEAVAGSQLVVLATPLLAMRDLLAEIAPHLSASAVVTDLGSAKASVVSWAESLLPRPGQFVGGHPMAGSEQVGIEAATANLYTGCTWCLTPTVRTEPTALALVTQLVEALGARPHRLPPEQHDQAVALVSHLPLLAAGALSLTVAQSAEVTEAYALAAGGFRDTTRVASGSPRMARDICLANSEPVGAALEDYIATLQRLQEQVTTQSPAIEELFATARDARTTWLASHA